MTEKFNFGELVLAKDALEEAPVDLAKKPKRAAKKANAPVFTVEACSGVDFVIKRTTASTEKLLVILVSQEQYYVKNLKTGKIEPLNGASLSTFLHALGKNSLAVGCQWLSEIPENTRDWRSFFLNALQLQGFKQAVLAGMVRLDTIWLGKWRNDYNKVARKAISKWAGYMERSAPLTKHIAALISENKDNRRRQLVIEDNIETFFTVFDKHGLDRARMFIDKYVEFERNFRSITYGHSCIGTLERLLEVKALKRWAANANCYGIPEYINRGEIKEAPAVEFQFDKLCDFLFEQSAREGFTDLREWLQNWFDSLRMQILLTGRVTDKYPKHLFSTHQILATEVTYLQEEIDKMKWDEAGEAMSVFDYTPSKANYLITHPATPDDMRAEATAMSHCLSSYICRVIDGGSMIFFCRKTSAPEKSHVTIEVSPRSMRLVQVKAHHNTEADRETMAFIGRWCKEKGIRMGEHERTAAEAEMFLAA